MEIGKVGSFRRVTLLLILATSIAAPSVFGALAGDAPLKAKKEPGGKGYIFFTSHDEIVAGAKKEGKLRLLIGLDSASRLREAFVKKYPFVDVQVEDITGGGAVKIILELKAGTVRDWDVINISPDFYSEYIPHLSNFDIVGMARDGILQIPLGMIDPHHRNIVAVTSSVVGIAYNKTLISSDKVPNRWEDFLKTEFKGKKFLAEARPLSHRNLVPAMGLEWVLDYSRKLAAQQPVWFQRVTTALAQIAAGEYPLLSGATYHSTMRAIEKDLRGNLQFKLLEPVVPVRVSDTQSIIINAPHPHAALLWLEFEASPEGQDIIDKHEPLKASFLSPGSSTERLIRGKKLSVIDWNNFESSPEGMRRIVEAYGFPVAGK